MSMYVHCSFVTFHTVVQIQSLLFHLPTFRGTSNIFHTANPDDTFRKNVAKNMQSAMQCCRW